MLDLLPPWLRDGIGDDVAFWIGYLTNGKHLAWYASLQFTLFAAVFGGLIALLLGLGAAALRNSGPLPLRLLATGYINIVRGVPDVLFFIFFPLAFEQGIEWLVSTQVCTRETLALNAGQWPPCDAANWRLTSPEYLVLACVSLGIVYGAFAANVVSGALRSVPLGQLEAARAYGMSRAQVLWRVHIRQMWVYALPGLSNVWLLLIKATSLLSLLQILDFVSWAQRLGAANFSRSAGLVHPDWRWQYYLVLLLFYILLTWLSEKAFAAISRRVRRGMPLVGQEAM
ncbi:MAG: ABC transporter permease subunit [Hyphomicrobiales bacterium]|nr:MAG: ABC transporter permease subunit [Hyphomicrobiales bacterium]